MRSAMHAAMHSAMQAPSPLYPTSPQVTRCGMVHLRPRHLSSPTSSTHPPPYPRPHRCPAAAGLDILGPAGVSLRHGLPRAAPAWLEAAAIELAGAAAGRAGA
eukprot:358972-Chlamydomonas_euryale.AAC.2